MSLSQNQIHGLGTALNEATLLGAEVSQERRLAAATFAVLTLPESGPSPQDRRVQLLFHNVGRVAASLRLGRWDNANAPKQDFALEQLLSVVQSFGGLPVYGWEFFDIHDKSFPEWSDRLSLDFIAPDSKPRHSVTLFQEGDNRHLDICIWFDEFSVHSPSGVSIAVDEFIAGGKRWWDAFYKGDERTSGSGMYPIK